MPIPIKIVLITGASSVGKTTLSKILLERIPELSLVNSYTTREKRKEDINYLYLTPAEFRQAKSNGEFADWNEVYEDTYYGTKWESLLELKKESKFPLLVVDPVGAKNYYNITDCLVINLIPKDLEIIKQRIKAQRTDRIEERLKTLNSLYLDFGNQYEFTNIEEVIDKIIFDIKQHIKTIS